jgi:hypothetical protein
MIQPSLFYDSYEAAVIDTVIALRGYKIVGAALWPTMEPEDAGRKLAASLDRDKREKLSLGELRMIRHLARQQGIHILATYEARDAGYADPQPITPEDEAAQLQREYIAAVKALQVITTRIDRNGPLKAVGC